MATSREELLTCVHELNSPESPFVYEAEGDRIVGTWDIAHIRYIALLGAGQIDKEYTIEVELKPDTHSYVVHEHQSASELKGGFTADGGFKLSGGTSAFRGQQTRRTRGFVAGTRVSTPEGSGTSAEWSFGTHQIKEPLYAFLERNGWTKRKGFFGRLFGS